MAAVLITTYINTLRPEDVVHTPNPQNFLNYAPPQGVEAVPASPA